MSCSKFWLRSSGQRTLGDVTFVAKPLFTPGLLPTEFEVLEVMLFHILPCPGRQQKSKAEVASVVAIGLMEHWIFQNIYTIQKVKINQKMYLKGSMQFHFVLQRCIVKKILTLYNEFHNLINTPNQRRTSTWHEKILLPFVTKIQSCLDISCKDKVALRKQEKFHGVKMTENEEKFLNDQLGPRLMFCTTEVDRYKKYPSLST